MKNCVIWTRVSTKYQEDNGGSLSDQKNKCELFARQKSEGWDVWGNEVESDITMKGSEEDGICTGSQRSDESKDQSDVQSH